MIDSNINSLGEDRNFKIKIKHRTDGKGEMPKIKILDKPLGSNGEQRERIIEQDFNGENIRFHKQLNSYDCGPCLVLNALEVLKGGDESLKTIEDVRQKINSIVVDKHGPSSWVTDIDISLLFSRIEGIKPINTNFTGIVLSNELFQNTIDNSIQSKQKLFIFSGQLCSSCRPNASRGNSGCFEIAAESPISRKGAADLSGILCRGCCGKSGLFCQFESLAPEVEHRPVSVS